MGQLDGGTEAVVACCHELGTVTGRNAGATPRLVQVREPTQCAVVGVALAAKLLVRVATLDD